MRLFARIVVTLVAVALAAAALGAYVLHTHGLVADRAPGRLETSVARRLVVLSIPSATRKLTNPTAGDERAWREGAEHFEEHCAVCHGQDGRGRSEIGPKMYPPVPDLTSAPIQQMSDGALFAIVQNGVRWTGMPAFRGEHTPQETWQLVSFVRRMPELKPQDLHGKEPQHEPAGAQNTIAMDGTTFVPARLTVNVGDTVTWINKDPFPHNVTSRDGHFHSRDLEPDMQWQYRATTSGTFAYECTLHPGMRGTLIVRK